MKNSVIRDVNFILCNVANELAVGIEAYPVHQERNQRVEVFV